MTKHHVFLHIGPDDLELGEEDRQRLAAAGVRTTKQSKDDMERAVLEICRTHKSAGLRRKDVEGAWAGICRRTYALRSDAFLSLPGFFDADESQAALALDALHGMKVHLVATVDEGAHLPTSWSRGVKPDRIHVLARGSTATELAAEVSRTALIKEKDRLDKSLSKLKRRRKKVRRELAS